MFGIDHFGAFCAAVMLFLMLPGPGTFALLSATGQGGFRAGAAATLGLILGDQVLMWSAVAGVAALLAASPGWFQAVQYLGAAYLAWIGTRLMLRREDGASPLALRPGRFLRQAFAITVMNPKAIVFYMAFFPLFLHKDAAPDAAVYVAMAGTIAVLTAAYCLSLCALAGWLAPHVRRHRGVARLLERLAGVFLIGFALRLARG